VVVHQASINRPDSPGVPLGVTATLVIGGGIGLSTYFACVTPFAAFATFAALRSDRSTALLIVIAAWIGNQLIGYAFLGYPWTVISAAWGAAIGASACLAVISAHALSNVRPAPLSTSLPFTAALVSYELGLYAAAWVLPSGTGAFTASVIAYVFTVNVVALILLKIAHALLASGYKSLLTDHRPTNTIPQTS
jgi:hypothetical protein